ncbi:MAG TPA: VOC family protein, partial [Pseudolabrys sp.]|nr:VOC family protein [Pseudolabrys sp.]
MTTAKVSALRSVEIGCTELAPMQRFFTEVWNLLPVGEDKGVQLLRGSGAFHHIVALRARPQTALVRIVFDAVDRATVDALHAQVVAHGIQTIDPPAPLRQPHGDYGFGFQDPEGRNVAVVCGVKDHADSADHPDRPRKVSHINLNNGDPDASFACYRDALGFKLRDQSKKFRFLACNSDHHSVVLGFSGGTTLNHIAFEMPDFDAVMRGAGRMRDDGRPIEWGPGRHGPGNNVFCYFVGPEMLPIEYTAEMQQVDDSYRMRPAEDWKWLPGRLDQWGLTPGPSERVETAGRNYRFTA